MVVQVAALSRADTSLMPRNPTNGTVLGSRLTGAWRLKGSAWRDGSWPAGTGEVIRLGTSKASEVPSA